MFQKEIVLSGLTGEIAALQLGNPKGRPVVAVHGWLDNAASFLPVAERLDQYNWVCIDLPGHGKSSRRPKGDIYHFMDYIADLLSVVKELGWDKFDLVGHSLGAGICAVFSATFPEKAKHLVLVDGIGPVSSEDGHVLTQLRKAGAAYSNRNAQPRGGLQGYASWEQLIEIRQAVGTLQMSNAELLVRRSAKERDNQIFLETDRRVREPTFLYMSQNQVCEIFHGIECPSLLIQAKSGVMVTRATTAQRVAAIRDVSVVDLPGHHHLHMDSPDEVADEIRRFLG